MPPRKKTQDAASDGSVVEIMEVARGQLNLWLLGTPPGLLMNRQSEKVKRELLGPAKKKNKAEKERSLKHDPVAEFRAAAYVTRDPEMPTLLTMPSVSFKAALRQAAMDAGGTKAQIGRLCYVVGAECPVWGLPLLHMATVRQAGIQRTPDIRTRPLIEQWCTRVTIRFVTPHLSETSIVRLAAAAGEFIGVGDFRTEKGAGNYGGWRVVGPDEPAVQHLIETAGREAQARALAEANPADADAEDLLSWLEASTKERGLVLTPREVGEPEEVSVGV